MALPLSSFRIIRSKSLSLFTLLLILLCSRALSQSIVETLPGYPGPLPFKLETGYIGLGEDDDVHIFYYFIESERDPVKDPLVIWLTGGPGCSGFYALVYEMGPLNFDLEARDPSLVLNPYSWTKIASIIYIDSPPGTGFSYATTSKGYDNTDTKVVEQVYVFLQKWLLKHPNFRKNRLYISGDSYGAKWIPMVVWRIFKGNEAGDEPHMALQGYSMGNPITDPEVDENTQVEYAYRLGLISDDYYKMAKISCEGNYINPDSTNVECLNALKHYKECTQKISMQYILEPCYPTPSRPEELIFALGFLGDESIRTITLPSKRERQSCRDILYRHSYIWTNNLTVQETLGVRKGTFQYWKRCNHQIPFEYNVKTVMPYHHLLSKEGYQALVYSGDHDMLVPYIGTIGWIRQLNITLVDDWRPWFVEDQVAGYTKRYTNMESRYNLTFATVKGAGHNAPEYKRKECFTMFERFLSHNPL